MASCPVCGGEVARRSGRGRPPKFCEAHRTAAAQAKHWRATSPLPAQHRRRAEASDLRAEADRIDRQAEDIEAGRSRVWGVRDTPAERAEKVAAWVRSNRELAAGLRRRADELEVPA